MPLTTYGAQQLLNYMCRAQAPPAVPSLYLALFHDVVDVNGLGTEVAGNSYVRQVVPFALPSGKEIVIASEVLFPAAVPDAWGTIRSAALADAEVGGNLWWVAALDTPVIIAAGQAYVQLADSLAIDF